MPGPAPAPTRLKVLRGNPGKRPINKREPRPARGKRAPNCPGYLVGPARDEWRRVANELHALGLLTRIDRAILEAYCLAYGRMVTAEAEIAKRGLLIDGQAGLKQNPAIPIARDAAREVARLAAQFGMSPASRSKIQVEPQAEADPFDRFLAKRSA